MVFRFGLGMAECVVCALVASGPAEKGLICLALDASRIPKPTQYNVKLRIPDGNISELLQIADPPKYLQCLLFARRGTPDWSLEYIICFTKGTPFFLRELLTIAQPWCCSGVL